jgi:mannose-6-phosphate isomerase-like protein (cupin superfamily)
MEDGITLGHLDTSPGERMRRLRADLGVSTFGLNAIVLEPGQRGRIHAHERQEEVYLVLAGRLTLATEDEERELGPHDAARVAPGVRRQLSNQGSERLVLLAMGGAEPHQGRDGIAWASWDAPESHPPAELPLPPDLPR